jgi:hypothetical protein
MGAVLNGESVTGQIVAGMLIIFAGVALVRAGSRAPVPVPVTHCQKSEVRGQRSEIRPLTSDL